MLVAMDMSMNRRVLARDTAKGPRFECPACRADVILKKGTKIVHHFAHSPGSECAHAGETRQHLEMKEAVWTARRSIDVRCELELRVGNQIADVYLECREEWRPKCVAVECQHSNVTSDAIRAKLGAYRDDAVEVMYVVHAEAIPAYRKALGICALHERDIKVPAWMREVAIADPSTQRDALSVISDDGPPVYYTREFLQVWAEGRLWAVELKAIYRENYWNGRHRWGYLGTVRRARLLGELRLDGKLSVRYDQPVHFASLWDLAARDTTHESVLAAIQVAAQHPRVLRAEDRKLRRKGRSRCQVHFPPPRRQSTTDDSPPPQISLGLEERAAAPAHVVLFD